VRASPARERREHGEGAARASEASTEKELLARAASLRTEKALLPIEEVLAPEYGSGLLRLEPAVCGRSGLLRSGVVGRRPPEPLLLPVRLRISPHPFYCR
jgi:hypothetical protein